jgi:hypothetical protein
MVDYKEIFDVGCINHTEEGNCQHEQYKCIFATTCGGVEDVLEA